MSPCHVVSHPSKIDDSVQPTHPRIVAFTFYPPSSGGTFSRSRSFQGSQLAVCGGLHGMLVTVLPETKLLGTYDAAKTIRLKTVQCSHGVSVYLKPPAEANTVFLDPHDKSQKGCKCKLSLHDSRVTYSTPHPPQTRQFASLSFTNQGGHQNSPGSILQCSSLNEHDLASPRAPTPTPAPSPLGVSLHWLSAWDKACSSGLSSSAQGPL